MIDRDYLTRTLQRMVEIDSVNPTLVPGAAGEAEIAEFVARSLESLGLQVTIHESLPGRPSVVGRLRGTGGGRSLMLNGHIDTVAVGEMEDPFAATVRDGRIYGRGSYDMKGGVAACMAAAKAITEGPRPGGDVIVAAVADEEHSSAGTADVAQRYRCDGAIVAEPTELEVCVAHKGFIWYRISTKGVAAHGSRFDLGIDANMHMGRVLHRLERLGADLLAQPPHRWVGPPSMHAATIEGGSGLSTYAAECTLHLERRTIPGEREADVTGQIEAILRELNDEDEAFNATLETVLVRAPFEVDESAAIVRSVRAVAKEVVGVEPPLMGMAAWMDAAFLSAAGAETVVMGARGTGAHADVEWVDVESVVSLAEIFARTAVDYCRADVQR